MADHTVAVELFYGGSWHDVSADVLGAEWSTLTRGLQDNLEPIPGSVRGQFLSTAGKYNPANPTSPLFGLVGLNTPLRFTVDSDVQVGEVGEWRPTRPLAGTPRCGFSADGVLRRLGQGESPLLPALARLLTTGPPTAWWPLDDVAGSFSARSAVAGVGPLAFDDAARPGVVEATDQLGGGKRPEFMAGNDTTMSGTMTSGSISATTAGGYVIDFWCYFGLGDMSITDVLTVHHTGTTLVQARVQVSNYGIDPDDPMAVSYVLEGPGAAVEDVTAIVTREAWHHIRILVDQDGSDIDMSIAADGVVGDTDTLASTTLGRLDVLVLGGYDVNAFNLLESMSFSDLVVWDILDPPDVAAAGAGHVGETAADRFTRLCAEAGVPSVVVGDASASQPMGAQPVDTLTETLMDCVRTDAAMMFSTRGEVGLTFRTGRSLYGQNPVLTLDLTAEQVAAPVDPIVGDQLVRNDVTAKSSSTGVSARSVLTSGPMSVQAPPDGVGRYDTTWSVNPASDGALEGMAAWHVNRGTYAGIRYRSLTVDLDAVGSTGLPAALSVLDIGDAVLLTGIDPEDSPDDFTGLVIRIEQQVRQDRRLVTLVLVPAAPYDVGIIGNTAGLVDLRGQRIDSGTAALATGVSSSATSLSVKTTGGVPLTTDASAWSALLNGGGMFLTVGGEVVRVTAITGASSPQTVTVVRSVNGVTKSHAADAAVRVRNGIRVGL